MNGFDISGWTTVNDMSALLTEQLVMDFAWVRASTGYGDDLKYTAFRKLLVNTVGKNGKTIWGPYAFLGYSAQVGSMKWNAARGDAQMKNMMDLAANGGIEFQLPPAIDVENNVYVDNGVRQVVPMPSVDAYCDAYLLPAIEYLSAQLGRRPVLYASPNIILNYLLPVLQKDKGKPILECALWVASWTKSQVPAYWEDTKNAAGVVVKHGIRRYWKQWLAHQYAGDVRDYPGVDDIDLIRMPGTRAQLKAWCADDTAPLPNNDLPEPPPPTPVDPPADDIKARLARLEQFMAAVKGA
jgi:hypothetical protein